MIKYTLYPVLVCIFILSVSANSPYTMPPSSAGGSPTVPPSLYSGSGSQAVTSPIRESDFANRNRLFGYYGGVTPYHYGSLFDRPRYETANPIESTLPLSSFMRRTTDSAYGYTGTSSTRPFVQTPARSQTTVPDFSRDYSYTPNPDTDVQFGRDYQSITSQQYRQRPTDITDYLNTFPRDMYRRQRPLSLEPAELADYLKNQYTLLEEDKRKDKELLEETELQEEVKRPGQENTLEPLKPLEPYRPEEDFLNDKIDRQQEDDQQKQQQDQQDLEQNPLNLEPEKEPWYAEDLKPRHELPKVSHKKAEKIRGEHKTFESFAKAKYESYMKMADEFMKAQKYYKAADAYTLAAVFDTKSAPAHLGKSHALLAAGEYMSSSFYLQQAISLDKEYALQRVDMVERLGDRDLYDKRKLDITQWYGKTQANELAFLMAYLFYTSDQIEAAQNAINAALVVMKDSPEAQALKEVIEKEAAFEF